MRPLIAKIKPANGFSHLVHLGLLALLPVVLFILVRVHFIQLAFILILLSKWRMFAVRPRFWPANIRANAVDMIVAFSILSIMEQSLNAPWQALWAVAYIGWLTLIKPGSSVMLNAVQAGIAFMLGLSALYQAWGSDALYALVFMTGLICYLAARHFFDSFDEPYAKLLSYLWAYFGAALTWVLGHWLLFYGQVAQITLLLVVLGYGLAALYYLDHFDKLSKMIRRQFVFIMIAVVVIVLTFSNWGDKIV